MNPNLQPNAPTQFGCFPGTTSINYVPFEQQPICPDQSQLRSLLTSPPNSGTTGEEQSRSKRERDHRVIINRARIAIDPRLLAVEDPKTFEVILNNFQDKKGKRAKAVVLSDLTALHSDSITIQVKKEYIKRQLAPEPQVFLPEDILGEIHRIFKDPKKQDSVRRNVRKYTPAIWKTLEMRNRDFPKLDISRGIQERDIAIAYGLLPSLLNETTEDIYWYKKRTGKLHPLSLVSLPDWETCTVCYALLMRIGIHSLLTDVPYPEELKKTFSTLAALLFEIEPKPDSDMLIKYTRDRLVRFEKEIDIIIYPKNIEIKKENEMSYEMSYETSKNVN